MLDHAAEPADLASKVDDRVVAGRVDDLRRLGQLTTKLGSLPVVVFWHEDRAYAIEDRCPHLGFPLHRGTVESGLLTCHWHNARFDLESGCTLDLWADDARGFDVELDGTDVVVVARGRVDERGHAVDRLQDGMEEGLTLVIAKAVFALLELGEDPRELVRRGIEYGTTYRAEGWGTGLTILVAMANVLEDLDPDDRSIALIHGLRFVSRDTAGRAPRFPVAPLATDAIPAARLAEWFRRFVDIRSSDAAERVLQTALANGEPLDDVERLLLAAVTDHVFVDGGHTLDFTNKAFEAVSRLGPGLARTALPSLVGGLAGARRSEESGAWRHPIDLVAMADAAGTELGAIDPTQVAPGLDVGELAWRLLDDDPASVLDALVTAARDGAGGEQIGRALALAASLRLVRFHVQNDHADWNDVHHGFTAANALHQSLLRAPGPETMRGAVHAALRLYLDRFLNIPPARLPDAEAGDLDRLATCWEAQGEVDRAGNQVWGFLHGGGSRRALIAALGHALLAEDATFHWYQLFEASVRQAQAWPEGSDESALILVGFARFLAAHTPTRRELPSTIRTAARLRRGEHLFEVVAE